MSININHINIGGNQVVNEFQKCQERCEVAQFRHNS